MGKGKGLGVAGVASCTTLKSSGYEPRQYAKKAKCTVKEAMFWTRRFEEGSPVSVAVDCGSCESVVRMSSRP